MKRDLLLLLCALPASQLMAQAAESLPDRPIARAEVLAAVKRQFAAMDANHDGSVSAAEFQAYRGRTMGADAGDSFGHVGGHWLEHADQNGDGRVTLAEAQARPMQLFDSADLNHDGIISLQERKLATLMLGMRGK